MNNKRKGQPGLVGKKIRHRDGTVQTHHVKDGSQTRSKRSDRDALRASRPVAKPTVDADTLRYAVEHNPGYDPVGARNAFERGEDYVSEYVEVHGGSKPRVILTRAVEVPVGAPDRRDGETDALTDEAWGVAQEAFDRGDRQVSEAKIQGVIAESWVTAKNHAESIQERGDFTEMREAVEVRAEEAGIDLDGVEVVEVETVECSDERDTYGLREVAQEELDIRWAEADADTE